MSSVFLTYPLELIRVRMAYSTRHTSNPTTRPSFLSAMRIIYAEGPSRSSTAAESTSQNLFARYPILKFYRGFTVSVAGMIPYAGTSFLVWGFLHSKVLPPKSSSSTPRQRKPLLDLGFGAVAGLLAQTVSYPFEVVRRRMQVGGLTSPDRWLRWSDTVRVVWETRGWRGFYVGLTIGYLKVVPMKAVSFAVWQALRPMMGI